MLGDDIARALQHRVETEQARQRLPSLVVGYVRAGELVWCGSAGASGRGGEPPTSDTQYRIGSITKTFTAVSVMRLRDEGRLDLTDQIGAHLPELGHLPINIAQLLSHTSGLRAEPVGEWWERVPGGTFEELAATSLRREDLLCRPGRRYHYSNLGFAVLGEVVARRRGRPFFDVVADELLSPLRMRRTTPRPVAPSAEGLAVHPLAPAVLSEPEHDAGAMAPAGQLWSTIGDLARWSGLVAGRHPEILSPETLAEMSEPQGIADLPGMGWGEVYGLGFLVVNEQGRRACGHVGAMPGHWAMLLVDQESKDAVLGLSNSTYSGLRFDFFPELLSFVGSEVPMAKPPFDPRRADRDLLELTGRWYWGPVPYDMGIKLDGTLELVREGGHSARECSFAANGDGTFRGDSGYFAGERLEVHRAGDGTISHLEVATFILTRVPYSPERVIPGGVDELGWQGLEP